MREWIVVSGCVVVGEWPVLCRWIVAGVWVVLGGWEAETVDHQEDGRGGEGGVGRRD